MHLRGRLYRTAAWKAVLYSRVEGSTVHLRGRLYRTAAWKAVLCIHIQEHDACRRRRWYLHVWKSSDLDLQNHLSKRGP